MPDKHTVISEGVDASTEERRSRALHISPAHVEWKSRLSVGDGLVVIIPALQFVQFNAIGIVFASDLLLLFAFPLIFLRRLHRLRQRQVQTVLILGLAWFLGQVFTDMIRQSQPEDFLRGWSKIALTITHFAVIWVLLRNSIRRFVLYGIGVCIGGMLTCLVSPNRFVLEYPWKFGFALPVTFAVIIIASCIPLKRQGSLFLFVLVALSGVNLFLSFRSLGVTCLVCAGFSYLHMFARKRSIRLGKSHMLIIAAAILLSIAGFQEAYEYTVQNGMLGADAQAKYDTQQGVGGLLLGGRSEILSSAQAILDSPIIGHGSWARDPQYAAILRQRRAELGYKQQHDDGSDLIPSHSHIFGAWVEAGILGALFWLWILKFVVVTLFRATGEEPLLPMFAFIAFLLCWDILFSPYGAERRFLTPYFIAGIVLFSSFTTKIRTAMAGVSTS